MQSTFKHLLLSTISVVALAGAAQAADPAPAGVISNILDGAAPGTVTVAGITVYGTFDVGGVYNSHAPNGGTVGSNYINWPYVIQKASAGSNFSYQNNAFSQSALGVKGTQKLADLFGNDSLKGWSVNFDAAVNFDPLYGQIADICKAVTRTNAATGVPALPLTSQIFAADGSRCGQIFGGDAWGSLKNDVLGELRFGRQLTLLGTSIGAYDPASGSYSLSLLAFSGTVGAGGGATEDSRWNNSLKYINTIGPVRVGAAYRFDGGGQGGDAWSLQGGIDIPGALKGLSIDGVYAQEHSIISAGAASATQCTEAGYGAVACRNSNLLSGTVFDAETWAVMAKYKFGEDSFAKGLTVMGGYERIDFSNASGKLDNTNTIGGYVLANASIANGINYTAFGTDKVLDVVWVGGKYQFTPKLVGGVAYYRQHQESFVAEGATGTLTKCSGNTIATIKSNCGGDLNMYSVSLDYQVTKRMDLYAGASWTDVAGGLAAGFLATSEYNLVSGVRFRF